MTKLNLILLTVGLGIALAAGLLLRPKGEGESPIKDTDRNTLTVVSLSSRADVVLLDIIARERVKGITEHFVTQLPGGGKYGSDIAIMRYGASVEDVLATGADVAFVDALPGTEVRFKAIRDAGMKLVDLGEPTGFANWYEALDILGDTLNERSTTDHMKAQFQRRIEGLRLRDAQPLTAMAITVFDNKCYGATKGSTLHDCMLAAGMTDILAAHHTSAFPVITVEEVLKHQPDVLITATGMAPALRSLPGAEALSAEIIELPWHLQGATGSLMEDTVAALVQWRQTNKR